MQDWAHVTVAILAGGLGTRLRSVVPDRPKVLAMVQDRPFLTYLLDQLATAELRRVVVCSGHLGEQLQSAMGETYNTLRLEYSQEPCPLGTGGALRLALPLFKSKVVLVMNGDSYCEVDLRDLWSWHKAHKSQATLVLTRKEDTGRYGRVQVTDNGVITRFTEKGDNSAPGWINAGICLINRSLLKKIPDNRAVSLEREMFPTWVGQGLYGYPGGKRFIDIGIAESYAAAPRFFTDLREEREKTI